MDFEIDNLIWANIRNLYKNYDRASTTDDVFSIVKEAVIFSIAKFDATKNVKLNTFVTQIIRNQINKINKYESYRSTESLDFDIETERTSNDDYEFLQTMRAILTDDEHKVFHLHFVEDYTAKEVREILSITRYEVEKCLDHIMQKFKSLEENRLEILTKRTQQDRFLNCSSL